MTDINCNNRHETEINAAIAKELKNNFFGENVTVAGLMTGNDLINQLKDYHIKNLVIPSIMLRPYSRDFLDNITVDDVEKALGCKIYTIEDIYSSKEFINIIKS